MIDGEWLRVSQVEYDAGRRQLVIIVVNTEPVKTASVLFLGVDASHSIVAVDQDGRQYQYQSESTGMRRESDTVLGAGTSTVEFDGIDDSVQQLTLTVSHSGILLRGPWSVPLQLP